MRIVSPLTPIIGEILFYFFFKNKKDCTGKRELPLLKMPGNFVSHNECEDKKNNPKINEFSGYQNYGLS